ACACERGRDHECEVPPTDAAELVVHTRSAPGSRVTVSDDRARARRGLEAVLVDLEDFSGALDLGVRIDGFEPGLAASHQGLKRLRLAHAGPEQNGALVGGAWREEGF